VNKPLNFLGWFDAFGNLSFVMSEFYSLLPRAGSHLQPVKEDSTVKATSAIPQAIFRHDSRVYVSWMGIAFRRGNLVGCTRNHRIRAAPAAEAAEFTAHLA
jgi:hypothetical protein